MNIHSDKGFHNGDNVSRCEEVAKYIVENGATVRAAAKKFGMSKSTVHKEVTVQLAYINRGLYAETREILEKNKAERR